MQQILVKWLAVSPNPLVTGGGTVNRGVGGIRSGLTGCQRSEWVRLATAVSPIRCRPIPIGKACFLRHLNFLAGVVRPGLSSLLSQKELIVADVNPNPPPHTPFPFPFPLPYRRHGTPHNRRPRPRALCSTTKRSPVHVRDRRPPVREHVREPLPRLAVHHQGPRLQPLRRQEWRQQEPHVPVLHGRRPRHHHRGRGQVHDPR